MCLYFIDLSILDRLILPHYTHFSPLQFPDVTQSFLLVLVFSVYIIMTDFIWLVLFTIEVCNVVLEKVWIFLFHNGFVSLIFKEVADQFIPRLWKTINPIFIFKHTQYFVFLCGTFHLYISRHFLLNSYCSPLLSSLFNMITILVT